MDDDDNAVPSTFTPRGESKGFIVDQVEAFGHMQAWGEDFFDAFTACISGHRMTPDLASRAIASYWRRYQALANYQESRGAAITLQAAFRGMDNRVVQKERAEAAARVQAMMRGAKTRGRTDEDLVKFRAAAKLQSAWRRHLAYVYVGKLRWQGKSKLARTFSWSNKSKRTKKASGGKDEKGGIKDRSVKDILAAAGADDPKPKGAVRRSMSFDRFSRVATAISSKPKEEGETKPAAPTFTKQLLFILLHRGPNGLGLELDQTNTVVNMVAGGAADVQGYFREGDTIASVDGIPLRGRLLQDVMDRSKNSYSFDVWRLSKVEPDPPPQKENKPVRRAFSWDRKKR